MDFLSNQVGPLTLLQWLAGVVVLSVVFGIWNNVSRSSKGSAAAGKLVAAECIGCGWKGNVSQYHRKCPKCGNAITRRSLRE